ncbi:hypothetical protein [Modicisalibacter luteus]|uniref:hypothetical protein n=1 Tax=Modicisalibacter luteus TaxID=453962 RepID=UPI00363BD2D2
MPWFKLEATNEQATSTFEVELMAAFQRAFMSNRGPRDMAMFSEFNHERGATNYYFTHATQKYASELLNCIGASLCELPRQP